MPQNRWAAFLGALILLLAGAGLYFIVSSVAGVYVQTANRATQTELDRYCELIKPLVMFDPPAFDSPAQLENRTILCASAWLALSRLEHLQTDELNYTLLPGAEVRAAAVELFGPGTRPDLDPLFFGETPRYYNSVSAAYHIPNLPVSGFYPRLDKAETKGKNVTLTVSYLLLDEEQTGTVPVKQRTYVLTGENGKEIISAVK